MPTGFVGGVVESWPARYDSASLRCVSEREAMRERLCLNRSVGFGAFSANCCCNTIASKR